MTYPGIDTGSQISVLPFQPNVTQGQGISYTGLGTPIIGRDVLGNTTITYRANFVLDILRQLIDPISNEEITEFIIEFERWVIEQSIAGHAPRFGNDIDYQETMWAQGGILYMTQMVDTPIPFAAYRTNIIIQYQNIYESETY